MESMDIAQLVLRIVLAVVFIGMGVLHFLPAPARAMRAMIPPAMRRPRWPSPRMLVMFTGLCEIAGGIGLLIPATQVAAGVALAVFLIAVFPANAYAAKHPDRFGRAAIAFWPRLVGQVVVIGLVLLAVV
jgi:uncharacterized membrane protein